MLSFLWNRSHWKRNWDQQNNTWGLRGICSQWHADHFPKRKKARMSNSKVKTMSILFFDSKGVDHKKFVPQKHTVNVRFRKMVIRSRKKHLRYLATTARQRVLPQRLRVREFMVKHQVPYPRMVQTSPQQIFLFPWIKTALKGTRFSSIQKTWWRSCKRFPKTPSRARNGHDRVAGKNM